MKQKKLILLTICILIILTGISYAGTLTFKKVFEWEIPNSTSNSYKEGYFRVSQQNNPSVPVQPNSLNEPERLLAIELNGNYSYVIGTSTYVFNISNPNLPFLAGSNENIKGWASTISGNHIFIAGYNFRGIDISNPENPIETFQVGSGILEDEQDVAVKGDYGYVSDMEKGLTIFDISNLSNVQYLTCASSGGQGIAIKGDYLYINTSYGFEVYNITNPANPQRVTYWNEIRTSWLCSDPSKSFIYNLIYDYYAESWSIVAIDVSDPNNPQRSGSVCVPGEPRHLFASGNYVYVASRADGLYAADFTNPQAPFIAGSYKTNGSVYDVKVRGDYVYLADGPSKKFIVLQKIENYKPGLTVISPNGGESWITGSTHAITWASTGVTGDISISLTQNGTKVLSIGTVAASAETFSWEIPHSVNSGNNYKIHISGAGYSDDSNSVFIITSSNPWIKLSHEKVSFGCVAGEPNYTSYSHAIRIINMGSGTLDWIAVADQPWIDVFSYPQLEKDRFYIGLKNPTMNPGKYTGTVTVTDPAALNSPQVINVLLTVYEKGSAPFGEFSTPADGSITNGSIPVTGWVLDDIQVLQVKIFRKPTESEEGTNLIFVGDPILVEGARPDVEAQYPDYPGNYKAGWGYMLLSNSLPNGGNGTYTLVAIATDIEGNTITLGEKSITCDNAHEKRPFGAIDTPVAGSNTGGSQYINFGWVLTPYPNMIPIDGSTISVYVDGKPIGNVVYNQYRVDIATLFPGYANSNGAGGYYYINTKNYENGLHTISWSVVDNAGNENGIGSRFFNIQNYSGFQQNITKSFGECRTLFSKRVLPAGGNNPFIEQKTIQPLQRVEIPLVEGISSENSYKLVDGLMRVGEENRPLPIGSTIDRLTGIFYWQPGPGFYGDFNLVFILEDNKGFIIEKNILISIR